VVLEVSQAFFDGEVMHPKLFSDQPPGYRHTRLKQWEKNTVDREMKTEDKILVIPLYGSYAVPGHAVNHHARPKKQSGDENSGEAEPTTLPPPMTNAFSVSE